MSFGMGTEGLFDYGSGGAPSGISGGDLSFSALEQGLGRSGYD